jgi:hypothetical protein
MAALSTTLLLHLQPEHISSHQKSLKISMLSSFVSRNSTFIDCLKCNIS